MVAIDSDTGILRRMLGPDDRELPAEVARFFLGLSLSDADQVRVRALSEKANEGDLTPQEHDELAMYVVLGDFLAIMQARARTAVKSGPSAT